MNHLLDDLVDEHRPVCASLIETTTGTETNGSQAITKSNIVALSDFSPSDILGIVLGTMMCFVVLGMLWLVCFCCKGRDLLESDLKVSS